MFTNYLRVPYFRQSKKKFTYLTYLLASRRIYYQMGRLARSAIANRRIVQGPLPQGSSYP